MILFSLDLCVEFCIIKAIQELNCLLNSPRKALRPLRGQNWKLIRILYLDVIRFSYRPVFIESVSEGILVFVTAFPHSQNLLVDLSLTV